jgi:glycosyltransferase involved in cell wall biosynthesis
MLALLLWVFSVYGFLSAVWHIFQLLSFRRPPFPPTLVFLVVRNGESYIEGLLRRIAAEIVERAPQLRVVVLDDRSEDHTLSIVERMAAREPWLEAVPCEADSPVWLQMFHSGQARRWIGFDLRVSGVAESVMSTLNALCRAETGDGRTGRAHNRASL